MADVHAKRRKNRSAHGAAVWRPVVMHLLFYRVSVRHSLAEAGMLGSGIMSEVIIKDMKKVYDNKVTAVHDFNLTIADKEFIVLVGPSGCGKSTSLRMVAGLEDISGGELYIDGKLVNVIAAKDRDIAMVFQNYALYPHMSVYDNMAFALKLKKTPKEDIDKKVREVAEILDITQYLDRKPKALSGGQQPCDIVAGIRPQHIRVGDGKLYGDVEVSEMLGSEVDLHANCGGDDVVMVLQTIDLNTDVSIGSRINFTFRPDLIQLFDKETGNNLIWYDAESVEAHSPKCKVYDF